ncbi:hybrid sensor histidine kinase/response regulator [Roseomonas indoligenes]|uniref:Chemotaxis protein CheA n=1 Tax=Roseomonas indoligenes TaxID=2820811 RepID=A0A940S7J8_9PROT|nr:hybrid sensor histidine kinase/response regulator [Pararoseomonas indoligenes]MBP0495010.1 hybrid sensor histidine kinase/response regulator [Pararoseomonas indoligenes]
MSGGEDYSQFSLLDLFRMEAETHGQTLTAGLLVLERDPTSAEQLEACMRAAHSLKGAARIIDLTPAVDLTHVMEDLFVAAQRRQVTLGREQIDLLLRGVDLLGAIAQAADAAAVAAMQGEVDGLLAALHRSVAGRGAAAAPVTPHPSPVADAPPAPTLLDVPSPAPPDERAPMLPDRQAPVFPPSREPAASARPPPTTAPPPPAAEGAEADRTVRIKAESLSRLLGLAGESLMGARRLRPFTDRLTRLRRRHDDAARAFDALRDALLLLPEAEQLQPALAAARERLAECRHDLNERLAEMEGFDRRAMQLAHRLYDEALESRMRPFEAGVRRHARTVRDLGRDLGKRVRMEIAGGGTPVDRDILERLDAPLGHLLRNAVDHGIEDAEERRAAGKPEEGVVRLEARHHAGLLRITLADDGRGVDLDRLRAAILARGLAAPETVRQLGETELLDFLFLPGFSMKGTVTEISGRGVGLDAVQDLAKQLRGVVRISTRPGQGTCFQFDLPLTLSVIRTLLVEVGGEPYALPLAALQRTLKLPRDAIETMEGQQHFPFEGEHVGLVALRQLLGAAEGGVAGEEVSVVVIGDGRVHYGLAVDRLLARQELVVRPLDPRLGKIAGISAAALMDNGSPVLILDVEDLLRAVEKLTASGRLSKVSAAGPGAKEQRRRVLVVDDSLTIRELERKLLSQRGYQVEVAVDGVDGWNAARTGHFDLIVSDVDMPRMDGIELVRMIRTDPGLRATPVMIVSYKDREEDRRRGLEAGADYYLTKGSFHDETLVRAVVDLIGEAAP